MKQISLLTESDTNILSALQEFFKEKNVDVFKTNSPLEAMEADVCVVDNYNGFISNEILQGTKFIKIHSSLLPAFDCETPIQEAFKAGVKVTGVTVCYLKEDFSNGTIIAQYPIFIDYTNTIDDIKEEIFKVKQKLCPFVIQTVLEDTVFCFDMLLKQNSCGGCGKFSSKN